jgi:FtsH-binding integral membrane protein
MEEVEETTSLLFLNMVSKSPLGLLLVQLIVYILIFLWDDHVGYLLCIIISAVVFTILIISYLVEKVEPSKVPSSYFRTMWILWLAPVIVMLFFAGLNLLQ